MKTGQPSQLKDQWGVFTHVSAGRLYTNVSKDHETLSWLTTVCTGMQRYVKVYTSLTQTVTKITVCLNTQRIIREYPVEIYRVTNNASCFTKQPHGLKSTQQLLLA
jgi:hypothetical protein